MPGAPPPDSSGTQQSVVVRNLDPGRAEYLAIRSRDAQENWSALSNVVSTTPSDFVQLTFSERTVGAYAPSVSRDGTKIAFHADYVTSFRHQLYAMSADGSGATQLTSLPEGAITPDWSPDGSRIAYSVRSFEDPLGSSELYVVEVAGGSPQLLESDGSRNSSPAWSPTGDEIAFQSNRTGDDELWIIATSGGEPTRLTDSSSSEDTAASWSPTGDAIVFASDRSGNRDLWLISRDGAVETQITFDSWTQTDPSWSPTGEFIACVVSRDDKGDIRIVRR